MYLDPLLEQNEILEDDVYDADGEVENNDEELYQNDDDFYNYKPNIDMKLLDRSFTNLGYLGYGDGIDLDSIDNTANW